jgi:hypothetical protein
MDSTLTLRIYKYSVGLRDRRDPNNTFSTNEYIASLGPIDSLKLQNMTDDKYDTMGYDVIAFKPADNDRSKEITLDLSKLYDNAE